MRPRCVTYAVFVLFASMCVFSQNGTVAARAEAQLEQFAEALSPGNYQQADVLYLRSKLKQSLGEHDEAVRLGEAAVTANPKSALYRLQLASVLSDEIANAGFFKKMSLAKRVRRQLETALELEPNNVDCLFGMMTYYERAPGIVGGGKDKAHRMADQIGRLDASKGYLAQAQLARAEKRTADLEALYLQAVQADPQSLSALASLANFYFGRN